MHQNYLPEDLRDCHHCQSEKSLAYYREDYIGKFDLYYCTRCFKITIWTGKVAHVGTGEAYADREKPKVKVAIHVKVDGTVTDVLPKDGKYFSLDELKSFVGGGWIQCVPLPDGKTMVVDDAGKLNGLLANVKATEVWKQYYPIGKFPENNDDLVVGDALFADDSYFEK